jgi:hypothetical protein
MNSSNCFSPYVITHVIKVSEKMFVFGIPVAILVLRFHKLKIPKFRNQDLDEYCEPQSVVTAESEEQFQIPDFRAHVEFCPIIKIFRNPSLFMDNGALLCTESATCFGL